ncbi:acyl-CoA carboxylase subunit epsilon [Streptomyces hydrogenans]|uniref:Acyl-CoA carboxylase subunit epsilon n=1 Tax=Streptomyces hydrogenans TaxID=1873719 RepID=A0ABQ3PAX3_9ACTN|nr:acyl-CoA carboxylase subunit epsilon [Streptomyces hydrogenans]GHG42574.1 hypothetical protein GCM10018784_65500 [Streptomyces hydrogenans]GHI22183.1 hypothetical protein Shyd_35540 [Streptomyces hydrogenans]
MSGPGGEELRVVRGAASPEELAAVTAVLLAVTRNRPADAEGTAPGATAPGGTRWRTEGGVRDAASWQRASGDGFGGRPCSGPPR